MHADMSQPHAATRKAWTAPSITQMPPLKDLTLQTGLVNTEGKDAGFTFG